MINLEQILITNIPSIALLVVTGLVTWFFKKLKTPKESLSEEVDLKLKLLNDLVDSLSSEINRCRLEIKDLKEEIDDNRKTLIMAYNCPNSSDCSIIKKLQGK